MKRTISFIAICAMLISLAIAYSSEAQSDTKQKSDAQRTAQHEARQQKRAERLAAYQRHIDSLVLSHNFKFMPQTMQQLPAGIMRNLTNPNYEVTVWSDAVYVCIPFLKGYTPPYYPVVFNYVLPSVQNYYAEQTNDGWNVTFKSTMFSATDYTFNFEIYSHYGGAMLTISSPFYNSVQYTGNIIGI